jgi:hypothetical protein
MKRYHLEILPPGTNSTERRQLRRFRQWRMWGALVALTGEFAIGEMLHSWQAPLYIAFAYLAGLAFGLESCVTEFEALDRNRLESSIGAVEYEAGWARLYALLALAARPAAA